MVNIVMGLFGVNKKQRNARILSPLDLFINDFSKTILSGVSDNSVRYKIGTNYFFLLILDGLTDPTNSTNSTKSTNNTFAVTKKDMKVVLNGIIQLSTLLGTPIKVGMNELYSFVRAFVRHRSKLKNIYKNN